MKFSKSLFLPKLKIIKHINFPGCSYRMVGPYRPCEICNFLTGCELSQLFHISLVALMTCVCVYHFHEEKTKKNSIPPFCFGLFFGGPNVIVCSCPLIFSGSTSNTKNSSNPKKLGYILQFW